MIEIADNLMQGAVQSPEPGAVTFPCGDVLTGGQSAKSEVGEGDPSDCCHHQPSTFIFDDEKVPPSASDRRVVRYSYYSYIQDVPEKKRQHEKTIDCDDWTCFLLRWMFRITPATM
jgi:hypothetical protein